MPGARRAARRPAAGVHHGGRGGGARRRPAPRGGGAERDPRPAPRRAAGVQGSLLHPRAPYLLRHPDRRVLHRRPGLHRGGPARRGGRRHPGQAQHDRAGHGGARRQPASRPRPQSLEPRALHRRLVERVGRGGGRRARAGRDRHGHRRIHPAARGRLRHHRAQADLWSGEPRGRHGAVLVERSPGADGAYRAGLRAHAAGDGGSGSAGRDRERAAGARLSRGARRADRRAAGRRPENFFFQGIDAEMEAGVRAALATSRPSGRGSSRCACPIRR